MNWLEFALATHILVHTSPDTCIVNILDQDVIDLQLTAFTYFFTVAIATATLANENTGTMYQFTNIC